MDTPTKPFVLLLTKQELITPEQLQRANELHAEALRLDAVHAEHGHDGVRNRWRAALDDFWAAPSTDRLEELGEAARERQLGVNYKVKIAARELQKRFTRDQVCPFLTPLLQSALPKIQDAAAELRATEESAAASFGLPLSQPSSTVRAAERVVADVERMLGEVQKETGLTPGANWIRKSIHLLGGQLEGVTPPAQRPPAADPNDEGSFGPSSDNAPQPAGFDLDAFERELVNRSPAPTAPAVVAAAFKSGSVFGP